MACPAAGLNHLGHAVPFPKIKGTYTTVQGSGGAACDRFSREELDRAVIEEASRGHMGSPAVVCGYK